MFSAVNSEFQLILRAVERGPLSCVIPNGQIEYISYQSIDDRHQQAFIISSWRRPRYSQSYCMLSFLGQLSTQGFLNKMSVFFENSTRNLQSKLLRELKPSSTRTERSLVGQVPYDEICILGLVTILQIYCSIEQHYFFSGKLCVWRERSVLLSIFFQQFSCRT